MSRREERVVGFVSDSGHVTPAILDRLRQVQVLFVEANYDDDMLEADKRRPWSTKQRIASRHGHLSNTQAGELITDVGCEKLAHVVLGHLSGDCNCPKVAAKTVSGLLEGGGLTEVQVLCANQQEPTAWLEFGESNRGAILEKLSGNLSQEELF